MAKIISDYLLPYENKWVAVRDSRKVVAFAESAKDLQRKLGKLAVSKRIVMTKVFPFSGSYSPHVS